MFISELFSQKLCVHVSRYILSGYFHSRSMTIKVLLDWSLFFCREKAFAFCKENAISVVFSKTFSCEWKYVNLNATFYIYLKFLSFYWPMFLEFISMCFSSILIISFLCHMEFWWAYSLRELSLICLTGSFSKQFMTVVFLLLLKLISIYLVVYSKICCVYVENWNHSPVL